MTMTGWLRHLAPRNDEKTSRRGAGRSVAAKLYSAPPPAHLTGLLRRRGLVRHVDDLHPAVHFRHRVAGVLELALAVADCDEVAAGDAELVGQKALDRVGAALGQV